MSYLASLNPVNLFSSLPGNVAQGLIWGLMALGVYITFRLLDFADLTVDGSFATGGAVTVVLILNGWSTPAALLIAVLAGLASGLITGLLHTLLGIPYSSRHSYPDRPVFHQPKHYGYGKPGRQRRQISAAPLSA